MIEIVTAGASAARARVAIFDFDGTLSVIRSGWIELMVPLCVRHLSRTGSAETAAELTAVAEEFVWRLTGKETIYQMMALADAIRERGATPLEPLAYKQEYLALLNEKIADRLGALRDGQSPELYLVPGAREILQFLKNRGLILYLASGTDDANVKEESSLLGLAPFFEGRIFGAQDDLKSFSKALLVQQLVSQAGLTGPELVVFGDGFVEIEEVKRVGGTTVGLATLEPDCRELDPWKRERLIRAGADFILPHFVPLQQVVKDLFPGIGSTLDND